MNNDKNGGSGVTHSESSSSHGNGGGGYAGLRKAATQSKANRFMDKLRMKEDSKEE